MSESAPALSNPNLSSSFGRARTLSRIMAVLFTIAFWVMVFVLIGNFASGIFPLPNTGLGLEHGIRIPTGNLHGRQAIGAMVAANLILVPEVLILHHTRKLFACFARGEVFAANPIAHIRATGMWLTVSFFTGIVAVFLLDMCGLKNLIYGMGLRFPGSLPALVIEFKGALFTGIVTTIAAHVMAEARRIADENASIL